MEIKRGEIYYADLRPVIGSEQNGIRPVLIIQNDVGNHYSPTVIAAAITSRKRGRNMPTHVSVPDEQPGLNKCSTVLLEQVRTIDKERLKEDIGQMDAETMQCIDHAIAVSFGLDSILAGNQEASDVSHSDEESN